MKVRLLLAAVATTGLALVAGTFAAPASSADEVGSVASSIDARARWLQMSSGEGHTCAIRADGTLWCWGRGFEGQLGLGDTTDRLSPTQVTFNDLKWYRVSVGTYYSCAIARGSEGALYCWGDNQYGQLGLGDTQSRNLPTEVGVNYKRLNSGGDHACAIQKDDTLWCWGRNDSGQLGLGDNDNRDVPNQVGSATWWKLRLGEVHSCAIMLSPHSLWCWGGNFAGQLGQGDYDSRNVPSQVGVATNWLWVAAHTGRNSCGIQTDHSLWCWGDNSRGAVGDGQSGAAVLEPEQIGIGHLWSEVNLGDNHGCASTRKPEGQVLYCWGANDYGQLGTGDKDQRLVPTAVTFPGQPEMKVGGTRPGEFHTCALTSKKAIYCWGWNQDGQLGQGDQVDRLVPTKVKILPPPSKVSSRG